MDSSQIGDRVAPSSDASIPVIFFCSRIEGEGIIRSISSSDAVICQTTAPIAVGQKLALELGLPSDMESLRIAAEVVEQLDDGFAVRFFFDGPEERGLVLGVLDLLVSKNQVSGATQEVRRKSKDGADPEERRECSPRLPFRRYPSVAGRVHFQCGGRKESGSIHDISRTGAHIRETTVRLQPGEPVELFFLMGANPRRMKALATVVRQTPTGFAVRFRRLERELERLVVAATPKPGTR
jgi:hypothetical protein